MSTSKLWGLFNLGVLYKNDHLGVAYASINTLPEGFSIGAATSAYQCEGAWNTGGKGENIWDHAIHLHLDYLTYNDTADTAADSYHRYKEDIQALKDMGMQHYRFSVSWSRVLPTGDITVVNQEGVDYYNTLINELLDNNIQPMLTMYHWDLPQPLQDLGGWANPIIADYFEDYARVLYTEFGDRVKWWLTLNEPLSFIYGYGSTGLALAINASGVGEYIAGHNALKAHARAYHLYDKEFRAQQNGKVSIVLSSDFNIPKTNSEDDVRAADMAFQFSLGWFAHPIYTIKGDYPPVMKERIGNLSKAEGRYRSRLPEFDDYWINYIKGTADYFAINHNTSYYVSKSEADTDYGFELYTDPNWTQSTATWLYYVPEGMRGLLNWISDQYSQPDIFITENGWGDNGDINDTMRIQYINTYMAEMLKAIYLDNVTVIGYTTWSLIDVFAYSTGYSVKWGLYSVNFSDPARTRTPKASAEALANIIRNKKTLDF